MAPDADVIAADAVDLQLEAMRKDYSSWHPCHVSFSPNGGGLVIKYDNNDSQDILVSEKEALMRIRVRSLPLEDDDCTRIKPGDHVVVNRKSESDSAFFDAEVEKVLPVRHSKRMHCRCSFMIKWLHQDLNGGSLKVASTSIMKLANKSIEKHPTISSFIDAVSMSNSSFSDMSSSLNILNDFDMGLHDLLEKQIEGIRNSVHDSKSKKRIIDEIFGLEGDTKEQVKETDSSTNIKNQTPLIKEELSDNKTPLNPLAARAALASLMSKLPKTLEISSGIDNISTLRNSSSETEAAKIPVKIVNVKKSLFSTNTSSSDVSQVLEVSTTLLVNQSGKGNMKAEVNTSVSRSTRAKAQKVKRVPDNNSNSSTVNNRRFTRSALNKEDENVITENTNVVEKEITFDHKKTLFTTPSPVSEIDSARRKVISKTEEGKAKNSSNARRLTRSMINNEDANAKTETIKESVGDEFLGNEVSELSVEKNKKRNASEGNVTSDGGSGNGGKKKLVDLKKQKVRSSPRFLSKT